MKQTDNTQNSEIILWRYQLHKTTCWSCLKEFEYEGEKYQDTNCPHCGMQNSLYDPASYIPMEKEPERLTDIVNQQKEEEMIDYGQDKFQGKFVYLPLMGEIAEFDIAEVNEVKSDNPKFNFSENVPVMVNGEQVIDDEGEPAFKKKDLGYHIEAKLKNGKILSITSMSAFIQVFKKNAINDGDHIKVFHKDKGEWEVTKL